MKHTKSDRIQVIIAYILGCIFFIIWVLHLYSKIKEDHTSNSPEATPSENVYSSNSSTNSIKWLYGKWKCSTPYGSMYLIIDATTITEMVGNEINNASYSIKNGVLYAKYRGDGGISTSYPLDINNQRIGAGDGYWYTKMN